MQNWEYKKLGDIAEIFNGNSINADEKKAKYTDLEDGYPYIATKDVGFDNTVDYDNGIKIPFNDSSFKIARSNSVFVCAEGGSAGKKVAFIEQDVCFGNKLFAIYPKDFEKINSRFIYLYVQSDSFVNSFKKLLTGIIGGVSQKKFANIEIPLPPLEEQKRIVKILDEKFAQLETVKANAKANLQNAKDLFQSQLTKAFSNTTWEKKRLGDVITVLTDFNANGGYAKLDSNVKMYDEPNYAIMVRTTDLEKNDFENGVKYVDKKAYDMLSKSTIYGNEIIMNKIGSAGKIYLMPCLNRPATLARNAFMMRFVDEMDVRFLFSYLSSPEGTASIMKHVHGAVTKTITKDEVRSIQIPFTSLPEQKRIIEQLDSISQKVRSLEEICTKQLANCDELKQAFLAKAFAGEV